MRLASVTKTPRQADPSSLFMKKLLLLCWLVVVPLVCRAQVTLSNWSITTDSLSFDLNGTVTVSGTPSGGNLGLLWMAAIGNHAWINNDMNPDFVVSGEIDGQDASFPMAVFSFTGSPESNVGLYLNYSDGNFLRGTTFDFTDTTANVISLHVELTSPGKYNPSQIDPAQLQLYWGGNAFATDVSSAKALGLGAVIPEPSTWSVLAGAGAVLAVACARFRSGRLGRRSD